MSGTERTNISARVSVIIPFYNCQQFIGDCIESVCRQSYNNLEILCINDGSTDESAAVIRQFQRNDSRIVLINQENKGVSSARNKGIQLATGEYILFIDGDDMISDHAVEHLVSSAKDKHADVVISKFVCKKDTLDVRNGLSVCIETDLLKKVLLNFRQYIGNIPEGYTFPNEWALAYSWGRLYHISLLNKGIRFNENLILGEDVLFNYDIFNASKNVCFLNQNLYFYRQHEESVTAKFQKRRLSNTIILSHEIEKRTEAEEKEIKKAGYQFILGRVVHCYTAYFPYIDQEKRTREEKKLISISYINRAVLKGKLRYCSFDKRVLCKSIGIKFLAFKMYIKRIVNKV